MKKTIISLIILTFSLTGLAFAQGEYQEKPPASVSIGPYFGWSVAGINAASVPSGTKNAVQTATGPNFGLMAYYPTDFTANSGFGGMLGFKQIPYAFDYGGQKSGYNFSYFNIGAFFNISGFTLGLDASFPMTLTNTESDIEIPADNAATCVDLKLGGYFKIHESSFGTLNVFLNAGYFLTDAYNNTAAFETKPAHVEVGLNYLLNTSDW